MKEKKACAECGQEIEENVKFCDRCLAEWYIENEVDDDIPSGDFDDRDRPEF